MWCLTAAAGRTSSYYQEYRDSREIAKYHHHEFDEEKARLLTENEVRFTFGRVAYSFTTPRLNGDSTVAIRKSFLLVLFKTKIIGISL